MDIEGAGSATDRPQTLAELSNLAPDALARTLAEDAGHTAQWLYGAACQGLVEAQTTLGQALLDGRGTPADAAAARRWFALAAGAGHAPGGQYAGALSGAWLGR